MSHVEQHTFITPSPTSSTHAVRRTLWISAPCSLQELEEHGPAPDAAIYNVLLDAEESAEGVREVQQRMRRHGVTPDERTYRWGHDGTEHTAWFAVGVD